MNHIQLVDVIREVMVSEPCVKIVDNVPLILDILYIIKINIYAIPIGIGALIYDWSNN